MVVFITINYNLNDETIPCVNSILGTSYDEFLVFVIDNGSREEEYRSLYDYFVHSPKVRVFRIEKNCGYVGAVNFGLRQAELLAPDYYLIMNNDTIIDKDAAGILVEAAKRHNNKAIVSGKVYYYDNPDILQHTGEIIPDRRFIRALTPGRNEKDNGQYDTETERDTLDDVFWLLPAELVKNVGLYCDYFFLYAEQADYSLRAAKKGYKLIYTPGAKIWHKVSMTTGGAKDKKLSVSYWRGQGTFLMQYRHLKTRYFVYSVIKGFASMSIKVLVRNGDERDHILAQLRGYFWGFRWLFRKGPNDGGNPYLKK